MGAKQHEAFVGSERPRMRRYLLRSMSVLLVASVLVGGCGWVWYSNRPLVILKHVPESYSRRSEYLTANVTGILAREVDKFEWRVNGGPWKQVGHSKRNPPPNVTVEIPAQSLAPGANSLELRAAAPLRPPQIESIAFRYDPDPIRLPSRVDWLHGSQLDVQDGQWEVLPDGRIRPVPGSEGFDRTVLATGAFGGGRRVETEVIYRGRGKDQRFGFGVFPLWGGQPDDPDASPRRGWRFSLLWYSNGTWGYGCEFSDKFGDEEPKWVSVYRGVDLKPGTSYRLITETWPEQTPEGHHVRWRQRCKWWPADEPEPDRWLSIADDLGAPLPPAEYAVAVFAHNSQVEFGPVSVEPLPPVVLTAGDKTQ